MTEETLIRGVMKRRSSKIRQHIFPLFKGYERRFGHIGFHDDERTDHKLLMEWLERTHDNLDKVSKYINGSYENAYYFMSNYYEPTLMIDEIYPYQKFVRQVLTNGRKRHPQQKTPIRTDQYMNKTNADMVRHIINRLKNGLSKAINQHIVQQNLPTIIKLTKVKQEMPSSSSSGHLQKPGLLKKSKSKKMAVRQQPSLVPTQGLMIISQEKPSSFGRRLKRPKTNRVVATTNQSIPLPIPYYTVNQKQRLMTVIAASEKMRNSE